MIPTDYVFWEEIGQNREKYDAEKARVEEAVISSVTERHPDIRPKIEVVDVPTPLTFVRYTGNWRGSYEGWQFTRDMLLGIRCLRDEVRGIIKSEIARGSCE